MMESTELDFHDGGIGSIDQVVDDGVAQSVVNWWEPRVDGRSLGSYRSMWLVRCDATHFEFLIPTFDGAVDHDALGEVAQRAARASGLVVESYELHKQTSPPDAGWIDDAVRVVVDAGPIALTSAVSIATKEALSAVARGVRSALLRRRDGDEGWRNDEGYL